MHINLNNLRTFTTVADCGKLVEAAERLGRTPSAVSMSLKQLTNQLGGALFETDRKSTLTPLGRYVLQVSRRALTDFEESMNSIQRFAEGGAGTVRIAAVPSFATRLLPELVAQYHRDAPKVRLELRDIDSSSVAAAVYGGSVDFGVASLTGILDDLHAEFLLQEPFGVVCKPDHPLTQYKRPIKWPAIKATDFINNSLCATINNPIIAELKHKSRFHVHNTASLLSFVRHGFGITLLPYSAVSIESDLCFLPLDDQSAVRQLYVLQHRQHRLNPAATIFKQMLVTHINKLQLT